MTHQLVDRDSWQEIIHALRQNGKRSILTGFGVFWGVFMLMILMAVGNLSKSQLNTQLDGFGTNMGFAFPTPTSMPYKGFEAGRIWKLEKSDCKLLKEKIPQIKTVADLYLLFNIENIWGANKIYGNFCGLIPEAEKMMAYKTEKGRWISPLDEKEGRKVCVLGKRIYETLFPNGEDPLGKLVRSNGVYYQVIGLLKQGNNTINIFGSIDETVFIPSNTFLRLYAQQPYSTIIICEPDNHTSFTSLYPSVRQVLGEKHLFNPDDQQALLLSDVGALFNGLQSMNTALGLLLLFVGIGTLIFGFVGVSNIMIIAVKERTNEIGIRRAVGATAADIYRQIVLEGLMLSLFFGLIGLTVSILLLQVIESALHASNQPFSVQLDFATAVWTLVLLVVAGTLAGLAPAKKAISVKPVDAMRDE